VLEATGARENGRYGETPEKNQSNEKEGGHLTGPKLQT